MIKLYTDGATNGQPGQAGVGIVIVSDKVYRQLSIPLQSEMTIHEAEWQGLILGLEILISQKLTDESLVCYTDSQLVAQSIDANYIKNKHLRRYLHKYQYLKDNFNWINVQWISSSKNKGADNLAKQALQKAIQNNN